MARCQRQHAQSVYVRSERAFMSWARRERDMLEREQHAKDSRTLSCLLNEEIAEQPAMSVQVRLLSAARRAFERCSLLICVAHQKSAEERAARPVS